MGFWKKLGKGLVKVAEASEEIRRDEQVVVPIVTTRGAAEDAGLLSRYGRTYRPYRPLLDDVEVVEEEVRDAFGQLRYRRKRII